MRRILSFVQVVANYYGNKKIYEPVRNKRIYWAGQRDSPPPDTPKCGFDGSKCPPDSKYRLLYLFYSTWK